MQNQHMYFGEENNIWEEFDVQNKETTIINKTKALVYQ